jgi:processive 1,2-diacylglycerol beta-glucosyltransferase/1,2-diacylglycerol 3-beta-galactosyltransferase
MVPLTRSFLAQENQREGRGSLHLVVVCGKNKGAFKKLTGLSRRYPRVNMTVYGYVHHMPQLLRQSDCVITKAGASFIMETLACQKPVIISTFIHGQELGNLRFVVQNRAGWFLRRPEAIYRKVRELAAEPAYRESIVRNIAALGIRPDIGGITDYIRETGNLPQVVHG